MLKVTAKVRNFAAVSIKLKQQIASRVLLAVFLPMLLLSSFHTHSVQLSPADEECADCVQHHCTGHIGQLGATMHECVFCQFLSLPMVVATAAVIHTFFVCTRECVQCRPALPALTLGAVTVRGPPAV